MSSRDDKAAFQAFQAAAREPARRSAAGRAVAEILRCPISLGPYARAHRAVPCAAEGQAQYNFSLTTEAE